MKRHHSFFRWLACIFMAVWSIGALKLYTMIPVATDLGRSLHDIAQYLLFGGLWYFWIFLAVAISIFYYWISKKMAFCLKILVPAFVLTMTFATGNMIEFRSYAETVRSYAFFVLLSVPGAFALFYSVVWEIFVVLKYLEVRNSAPVRKLMLLFERHPILFTMGILLVCWSPYIILYLPGSIPYDGAFQLDMYLGKVPFTAHHPPLSTWLMGLFFQFGQWLGSESIGIFFYTFGQTLLLAFAISLSIKTIIDWHLSRYVAAVAVLYFALFPLWPVYATVLLKDTLYMIFFLLYQLTLIRFFQKKQNGKTTVFLFVISLLLVLFRNNGIFIVALTALVFLLFRLPAKKQFFSVSCIVFAVYLCINSLLIPMLGIQKGSRRESLSVPFQQVARYVKYHGEDITTEERESIARVLDYDSLAENYYPYLSDPVKDTFREEATGQDLKNFFSTWAKLYWRHPKEYWKAFLEGAYLYAYPGHRQEFVMTFPLYQSRHEERMTRIDYAMEQWAGIRNALLHHLKQASSSAPVIHYLFRTGFYTWILILLISYLLYRKRGGRLLCFIPVIVVLLINTASPVNGCTRYSMPIMISLPVLAGFVLSRNNGEDEG